MMKAFLVVLMLACTLSFTPCQPFGPRLFYGQIAVDKSSKEKAEIFFNTPSACNRSYIQLVRASGMEKVECTSTSLHLSKTVALYNTTVHKCSLSSIDFEEVFHYNAFGWDGSSASPTSFSPDFIPAKIADITNINRKMNLIVLADWSHLEINIKKYTPLDHMFNVVASKQEINGLLINGDVGYDLDSNNCLNYEKFLVMLGETAQSIPVIMVTGNHQYNTQDNKQLFFNSFQFYKLDTELAAHLQIGPLSLLTFDPFELVLGKSKKDLSIAKFKAVMADAKASGRFIVPTSHYPLACSGTSKNCKNDRITMKDYWHQMFAAKVSLYLGAHYHTYQRIFPYLVNDTFTSQHDGYSSDSNYLISIVEGVAGNDRDIVEAIDKIQDFTASHTINETGFGVLEVDQLEVKYTHYSAKRGAATDQISISRVRKFNLRSE